MNVVPMKTISDLTPMDRLVKMADGSQYPGALRLQALLELGRRLRYTAPSTPTPAELVTRVMNDDRVPLELRAVAASIHLSTNLGE